MEQKTNLAGKLLAVQTELKVPKNQFNSFGKYSYRNAEDIVEEVKPLANKYGILLTLSDSLDIADGRVYIKSTAKVTNVESPNEFIEVTAYAREPESKKRNGRKPDNRSTCKLRKKICFKRIICY